MEELDSQEIRNIQPQHNYFLIIPAFVADDKDLDDSTKLLFGRLVALSNQKGYCWASNEYLGDLCGVKERVIQDRLNSLEKKGYIIRETKKQGMYWDRKIYPVTDIKNISTKSTNVPYREAQTCCIEKHERAPYKYNSSNNIKDKQQHKEATPQKSVVVPKKITAQKKEKEQKKIIKKPDPLSFENPEKDVCLFSSDSEFKKKKDFINSLDLEDSFVRILEDHTLEDLKIATEAATQWKNKKLKTGEPVHSLGSAILTALKKKWKPVKEKKQIEEEQTKQKQKNESSRKERYLEAKKLESEFATLLPFENTFSVSDSGVFLKIKGSVCPIGLNQEDCVEILKNHIKEYKK